MQITQRSILNDLAANAAPPPDETAPAPEGTPAAAGDAGAGGVDARARLAALFGTPPHGASLHAGSGGANATNPTRYTAPANGHGGAVAAGGTGSMPRVTIGTAAGVTKAAGLDLSRYSDAQLRRLDVVSDGKLDANEAAGLVRFADANGDGRIDKREQQALDYVLGKDADIEAMEAFVELHHGRIDERAAAVARRAEGAEKDFVRKDRAHDDLVDTVHRQERAMRDAMSAEGFTWTQDSPAQVREQMDQLRQSGLGGSRRMEELEWRLQYAGMRQTNAAELKASHDAKEAARNVRDNANVENRVVQALAADAAKRADGAAADVVRFRSGERIADLIDLRTAVERDPKVRDAFMKFAKAVAIQNAVRDGKLDAADVDMDKVKRDANAAHRVIETHTRKLEQAAGQAAKLLEDPKFRARLQLLPADERAEILTDLHSLIADTEAGYRFFKDNLWPGLQGKHPKNAEAYDDLKLSRHGSKLALSLTGVWGARIAAEGGKDALRLMDSQLARAIGVRPEQMPKIYTAMELARTGGDTAAREFLGKDPELKQLSGKLDLVAGPIAFASAIIAAHDLVKDPNLRNSLAAAKGASEIAEVLARAPRLPASIANYSRFAGRFGPPLDMIVGGLDGFRAARRNDVAGAIGGFTQSAGGIAGTAGVIAAAVGATGVGLPLAVIGSAVATLGSLILTLWGDSPTEQWLKANAPEYLG